ncbi:MAG TPA: hypothetical protein VF841_18480 [Anaeromyxobacter sp.]
MTRAAAVLLPLLAGACVPADGPMMAPFQDCLGCHSSSGSARTWTVAGTWAKGATVVVTDANGRTVTLRGNEAGNFYTAEPLAFPITVSVNGKAMKDSTTGAVIPLLYWGGLGASCNVCHRAETITLGPDMAPGSRCLGCHVAGRMASDHPFTAAGTFAPGQPVQVGTEAATTRPASGNFFVTGPVAFPASATVGGSSMQGGAPHGDCNACHGAGGSAGD